MVLIWSLSLGFTLGIIGMSQMLFVLLFFFRNLHVKHNQNQQPEGFNRDHASFWNLNVLLLYLPVDGVIKAVLVRWLSPEWNLHDETWRRFDKWFIIQKYFTKYEKLLRWQTQLTLLLLFEEKIRGCNILQHFSFVHQKKCLELSVKCWVNVDIFLVT